MTRAEVIQREINELQAKWNKAHAAGVQAVQEQAINPGSGLIAKSVKHFREAKDLREQIDLHETALEEAHRLDHIDQMTAWKRDIAGRIARCRKLADEDRMQIAHAMDRARAELSRLAGEYLAVSKEITELAKTVLNVPGMPPTHRADVVGALIQAAHGRGPGYAAAMSNCSLGSITQAAIDSSCDLDTRLRDLERRG